MPISRFKLVLLLFSLIVFPQAVSAHPGNTDSFGCHHCWTNCSDWGLTYGEYHCHKTKSLCDQAREAVTEMSSRMLDLNLKYGVDASCPLIPDFKKSYQSLIDHAKETLSSIDDQYCGTTCIEMECAIDMYEIAVKFLNETNTDFCSGSPQSSSKNTNKSVGVKASSSSIKSSYCGANMIYSAATGCKCKLGYKRSGSSCEFSKCPNGYTKKGSECIAKAGAISKEKQVACLKKNPCTCPANYEPLGNKRCIPK